MIEAVLSPADAERYAEALSQLRREYAEDDQVDPNSTLDRMPTRDGLVQAFRDADTGLVAHAGSGDLTGYGLVWSWVEDDGTALHLLDAWAIPTPDRTVVLTELFIELEAFVRESVSPASAAVLGANTRSCDPGRDTLLTQLGFHLVFAMVEMQLTDGRLEPAALPRSVVIRTVTPDDAVAIASLTERAWADRLFFTMPDLEETRRWLRNADSELFLLAEQDSQLIGLASAKIGAHCAEIDDVQVDPSWQRRGVATALVTGLVNRLTDRTARPIRLHTEAHDPAGGRSLYEHLGFVAVATHNRYRKQLGCISIEARP